MWCACSKSKLYRFDNDSGEWKERGIGQVRLLESSDTGKIRLLMRQEKTLKIRANHFGAPLAFCYRGSHSSCSFICYVASSALIKSGCHIDLHLILLLGTPPCTFFARGNLQPGDEMQVGVLLCTASNARALSVLKRNMLLVCSCPYHISAAVLIMVHPQYTSCLSRLFSEGGEHSVAMEGWTCMVLYLPGDPIADVACGGCSDARHKAAGAQRQREGLGLLHCGLCRRGAEARALLLPLLQRRKYGPLLLPCLLTWNTMLI